MSRQGLRMGGMVDVKEYEGKGTEYIQELLDYLDSKDAREYAVLFFADNDAIEIQAKLGLTAKERNRRQQQFKYWIDKYLNLPSSGNKWNDKSEKQRLKKRRPTGCRKVKAKKIPRVSPWRLQQEQSKENRKILRFAFIKPTLKPRPSPLFELDLSECGKEKLRKTRKR